MTEYVKPVHRKHNCGRKAVFLCSYYLNKILGLPYGALLTAYSISVTFENLYARFYKLSKIIMIKKIEILNSTPKTN